MLSLSSNLYFNRIFVTVAIVISALIVSFLTKQLVDGLFVPLTRRISSESTVARTYTLRGLFKNITDFTLFLISLLIILSYWGIDIVPILTGAGILGLAISFGAQTFIKDVISGMFIILEDQFHIGDKIAVDKFEGEVVRISLRLTVLKDLKGNYIYLPNSQISSLVKLKTAKKR